MTALGQPLLHMRPNGDIVLTASGLLVLTTFVVFFVLWFFRDRMSNK